VIYKMGMQVLEIPAMEARETDVLILLDAWSGLTKVGDGRGALRTVPKSTIYGRRSHRVPDDL
jgi:hypothetical protein